MRKTKITLPLLSAHVFRTFRILQFARAAILTVRNRVILLQPVLRQLFRRPRELFQNTITLYNVVRIKRNTHN